MGPKPENHPGQGQPVPGKRHQGNPLDHDDEDLDRQQGRQERHHEADGQKTEVVASKQGRALVEVVERGREHNGHGGDEGIFRGQASLGPEQHAAHDRGGRARKTRPQGQALEAADAESQLGRHLVQRVVAVPAAPPLDQEDHDRAHGQGQGHGDRSEQIGFDGRAGYQPHQRGGQAGQKQQP